MGGGRALNINLIGMRGVGKSNIARRLAVMTKRSVMSTDTLVEYESGLTIPAFVASHGWREFRDLEFDIVSKLAAMDDLIVDCGGGVIVDLDAAGDEAYSTRKVRALREGGPVVYLAGDIARLAAKTADDPTRPQLDAVLSAEQVMRRREPFYQQAADHTWFVTRETRQEVAQEIAEKFALLPPPPPPPGELPRSE
jgi:shikimate kinase